MRRNVFWGALGAFLIQALALDVCAQNEHVYFGILHSHTGYSDGSGLPPEAYQHARTKGGCDFFAITEHNHNISLKPKDGPAAQIIGNTPANYNGGAKSLVAAAQAATIPGTFVALYGQEFSTISSGNHANVFDVPSVITAKPGEFDKLVEWLNKPANFDTSGAVGIVQFNHPDSELRSEKGDKEPVEYGMDDFSSRKAWIDTMSRLACTIEVLNGPGLSSGSGLKPTRFESDYMYYLSLGFRLAPTGDQDNHHKTWGTLTEARTGIIADELTKPKLLAAIRARHVYATTDKNLEIIAHVNKALCGDIISPSPAVGSPLDIEVSIKDRDEPQAAYDIEVYSGVAGSGQKAKRQDVFTAKNGDGTYTFDDVQYTGGAQYVYFKVIQHPDEAEEDNAWTSPVWLSSPGGGSTPSDGGTTDDGDSSKFVASKKSKIYHVDPECAGAKQIKPANLITGSAAMEGRKPHNCKSGG